MKLFLDMDGVLADFVGSISKAHNKPSPYTDPSTIGISLGLFDIEKIWGITIKQLFEPSNNYDFWHKMDKTPEADELVKAAFKAVGSDNVAILTAPSISEWCVPGKRAWVRRHYPELVNKIIYGSAKEFLSGPDKILIDDRDKNIDAFNQAGGRGILIPRLWNKDHELADKALSITLERLDEISNY